jgi:hypothetical protein
MAPTNTGLVYSTSSPYIQSEFVYPLTKLLKKYALRPHPASKHPETPYNGVTLACSRDQEAVCDSLLLFFENDT